MALTLVATAGAKTANTYVTLAAAKDIVLEYLTHITSAWEAAADATRNIALVQATKDIDSIRCKGTKYHTEIDEGDDDWQPLQFPRADDSTDDDSLYIPDRVERATVLQACYLLRSGSAAQKTFDTMGAGIVGRGTGRLSETFDPNKASRVCQEARAELRPWIITSVRIERG